MNSSYSLSFVNNSPNYNFIMKFFFPIALLLMICTAQSVLAQTDVTDLLKALPKADGTYFVIKVDDINFYAVKKRGGIDKIFATDEDGNNLSMKKPQAARLNNSELPACDGNGCAWKPLPNGDYRCSCITTVLKVKAWQIKG